MATISERRADRSVHVNGDGRGQDDAHEAGSSQKGNPRPDCQSGGRFGGQGAHSRRIDRARGVPAKAVFGLEPGGQNWKNGGMKPLLTLALAVATLPLAAAEQTRDIEYARVQGTALHLDAAVPDGDGPFPIAILIHGGAGARGTSGAKGTSSH